MDGKKKRIHFAFIALMGVGALSYPRSMWGLNWSPLEVLFQRSAVVKVSLAVGPDNKLNVTWAERPNADPPVNRYDSLYYAVISEGEESSPVLIASAPGHVRRPRIAVDSNNSAHLVWSEVEGNRLSRLLHVQITGGIPSNHDTLDSFRSEDAFRDYDIRTSNSGRLYACWTSPVKGMTKPMVIRLRTWTGEEWAPATLPFPSYSEPPTGWAEHPNLFVDSRDSLHMVFVGYEYVSSVEVFKFGIRYSARAETDTLWPEPVLVYRNPDNRHFYPQIVLDHNQTRHIVWQEDSDQDMLPDALYYSYSHNGTDWSEPRNISQMGPTAFWPQVVVDGRGTVHVVWGQIDFAGVGKYKGIAYTYGRGESWSEPEIIFKSYPTMLSPDLAIDSNDRLHLVGATGDPRTLSVAIEYSWRDPDTALAVQETGWHNTPSERLLSVKNYPNPFNNMTFFEIETAVPIDGSLKVYNLRGKIINTLFQQENLLGRMVFSWDGKDMKGRDVPSGLYFGALEAVLSNKKMNKITKVLLIK